ncbi:MAG: SPOR domain-containing protein [Sphingomonadaceae bacterium]
MFFSPSVHRCVALFIALSAPVAVAQVPPSAAPIPKAEGNVTPDPTDQLAANLVILSKRPRDVNALIGAGLSAIAIGDGNAALGFLARAEEIAPTNGYIKSALGSALLLVERPTEALKLFGEAASLGVAETHFARDRGLAYDLRGESRLAQRDYAAALRTGPDDEVTRRMALSLGITGDATRGLALLDPLLIKQDQAAWRARAFILAMSGDWRSAERIALQVMPAGSDAVMGQFLRRLASLSPAERALAVNFGTVPSDGQRLASLAPTETFRPFGVSPSDGLIPAGRPLSANPPVAAPPSVASVTAPRRRPGGDATEIVAVPRPNTTSVPSLTAPIAPKPDVKVATAATTTRVGARVAPVPPQPELPKTTQVTLLKGVTSLPVPDGVRPPVKLASLPAAAAPVQSPAPSATAVVKPSAAPTPVFEIPPVGAAAPKPIETAVALATPVPRIVTAPAAVVTPPAPQVALASPPALTPSTPPAVVTPVRVAEQSVSTGSAPTLSIAQNAPPPTILPTQVGLATPAIVAAPGPVVGPTTLVVETATLAPPAVPVVSPSQTPEAAPGVTQPAPVQIVSAAPAPPISGLGSIIATIEPEAETAIALPSAVELRTIRLAAQRKAAAAAKAADKLEADALAEKERLAAEKAKREAEQAEAAKHPARIWVQVAGGANKAGLPATFKRLREANAELFKGLSAWSAPLNRTNRLLVGPFKSASTARDLVNKMGKAGLSVFTYSSALGQEIEKIGVR